MRIAHIVTYVSADGAFGGPVSVAIGQAEELAARGHYVELIAGWDGRFNLRVPGVRVKLFPVKRVGAGFSGTFSLPMMRYLHSYLTQFDIVHVHAGRDLITLPAALQALRRNVPLVVQTHGMVMPDRRLSVGLVDALGTRRVLRGAMAAFALTDREVDGLAAVGRPGPRRTIRLANGIKRQNTEADDAAPRARAVLFLARLHPRKRVMSFAEAGKILLDRGTDAEFIVIGPDEGDLGVLEMFIRDSGLQESMRYSGAIGPGESSRHLAAASLYVLPSLGEVFPMTVLEAMAVGTPVVVNSDCGIAPELKSRGAALVTDGSPSALADAIQSILNNPDERDRVVSNARLALDEWLSIDAVVDELEATYFATRSPLDQ